MKGIFFNSLQAIGGIILSIGYIPQIQQVLNTHQVQDLNFSSFLSIFIGVVLMEAYAVYLVVSKKTAYMSLATNTASVILSGIMVFLILLYK